MKICTHKVLQDGGIPYLVKDATYIYPLQDNLNKPETVADMMRDVFKIHQMAEEYVYAICMNNVNKANDVFEVSHGTTDASMVNPREILKRALLAGATKLILIHNHPAGTITPSKEDIIVTKQLKECCGMMDIPLVDHVIVGGNNHYSFRAQNML